MSRPRATELAADLIRNGAPLPLDVGADLIKDGHIIEAWRERNVTRAINDYLESLEDEIDELFPLDDEDFS